ncbi:MAG: single-stranded-DNA-specific exonuclease RecJ [Aquificae bacterium]|nr:single-stranded-DNA-specific exonuclease RecJ [Aquificota bacterium]
MKISLSGYDWIDLSENNTPPPHILQRFGKVLGQLLYNRKSLFEELEKDKITPDLKNLLHPSLFKDIELVAYSLAEDLKKGKKIAIYGDYDADGITSTALLANFFTDIGVKVSYYIPNRFSEGYGLNKKAIKKISKVADVMIVVDSGTSSYEELLYAKSLGLKVYILDHHEPKDKTWKQEDVFILNPKLHDDLNPVFKHLASVGLSFYLMIALRSLLNLDIRLKPYLDIVSIGTIADVVPLSLINRILVKKGLEEINKKKRVGIKALLESASLDRDISSIDIGFILAPRLNASGRIDDANKAVKLLITRDLKKANALSQELDFLNKKRQKLTEVVFKEAQEMITEEDKNSAIVVWSENWHEGVVGIVAGKLAERYRVPSIVLSIKNGKAIGSARSISGINIYESIKDFSNMLTKFGGHSAAAGLSLYTDNLSKFKEAFQSKIYEHTGGKPVMIKEYDMSVPFSYWNIEHIESLKILEPFGEKNPFPRFLAKNVRIEDFMLIGNNQQHIKFWFKEDSNAFPGLWWGASKYIKNLSVGTQVDIVYTPRINNWNNTTGIDFIIDDIIIYS